MILVFISVALTAVPAAYELDFGVLAPNPRGVYDYTVVLSFPGEPDVKIPMTIARKLGPEGAADTCMETLGDTRWKIKRDGVRITVYGYDDVRILNLTVEGNGPKPQVRRVLALPQEKKK
jgi:hypothetical protein